MADRSGSTVAFPDALGKATGYVRPMAQTMFYGWRVVAATFMLAVFGWGLGFYGPPVFLHAVRE
ncbi:MAG: hypothetical protein JO128_13110, partial [Alphaproteobacteria bacterium]|nr:hypothetical protein [Alphaproteobacteria bacterium]